MLDVVYEVCRNLGKSFRYRRAQTLIRERFVLKQLLDLKFLGILPFAVAEPLVDPQCFGVVSGDLETVFVYRSRPVVLEFGLVDHSRQHLGISDIPLASLPSGSIQ